MGGNTGAVRQGGAHSSKGRCISNVLPRVQVSLDVDCGQLAHWGAPGTEQSLGSRCAGGRPGLPDFHKGTTPER